LVEHEQVAFGIAFEVLTGDFVEGIVLALATLSRNGRLAVSYLKLYITTYDTAATIRPSHIARHLHAPLTACSATSLRCLSSLGTNATLDQFFLVEGKSVQLLERNFVHKLKVTLDVFKAIFDSAFDCPHTKST
ncbi:hypothetical protein KCU77_g91, partial [Aureobasidium melanogenum]